MFDLPRLCDETFVRYVDFHDATPSTNDLAMRWAVAESLELPVLVLAETQTAGRGRGGNRWWSARGGLTFSLVLEPAEDVLPPQRWPLVSLVTALAVREALQTMVPAAECGAKWPNDLYLGGRKVGGILIESVLRRPPRIVIGIGINLNNSLAAAPAELQATASALCDAAGRELDATDALVGILQSIERWFDKFSDPAFPLAELWRPHCVLRGRVVRIENGTRQVVGVCQGIADDGALLVQTESELQRCHTGTVTAVDGIRPGAALRAQDCRPDGIADQ